MKAHRLHSITGLLLLFLGQVTLVGKPTIVVSIPPQKAFVQALTGAEVDVVTLIKPGQNPTNFSLTPRTLAEIATAEVYFSIGVPMETAFLPKLRSIYPNLTIVDTSAGIRKRSLESHSHDDEQGAHDHAADPHIWLSPGLVKIQLRSYARSLKELLPDRTKLIDENLTAFFSKLEAVDTQLKEILAPHKGAIVFVYHPAFGYFLERYGLRQETVELEGKQPSPKQLNFLIKLAKELNARTIFVQPQFERRTAHTLAKAIGGKVEVIDPLAENYLDNLILIGETIASSYR
ncbi:MAG: zinc ABC transporter substrate-binding protein [Verrucomicrobia bacterium]|nr:zinc ABC transporter substrate-binding protein [Verrucomicrobiota bacterium]MDA1067247.1 zinc ABC transporter substrate-binding protein [Verrucomicrobiota bacterium]